MLQQEYFTRVLALKARYDLATIITYARIMPSDTETYPLSSVRDASS